MEESLTTYNDKLFRVDLANLNNDIRESLYNLLVNRLNSEFCTNLQRILLREIDNRKLVNLNTNKNTNGNRSTTKLV